MSMILTIVASPEKLHVRLMRLCSTISSRFAMSVTHTCIFMALASESVLRRGITLMPRCANLQASGNIESLISRRESKRLIVAGVKTFDCGKEHHYQMLPRIETLYVAFAAVFTAEFENF